jgi:hypothetical protein
VRNKLIDYIILRSEIKKSRQEERGEGFGRSSRLEENQSSTLLQFHSNHCKNPTSIKNKVHAIDIGSISS